MKTFLAALLLLGICILGMCIGVIFHRGFPKYDVGSNEKMRERGIVCFKEEDAKLHQKKKACSGNFSDACKDCSLYGIEFKKGVSK